MKSTKWFDFLYGMCLEQIKNRYEQYIKKDINKSGLSFEINKVIKVKEEKAKL